MPTNDRRYLQTSLSSYERACVGKWPAERIAAYREGAEAGRVWQEKLLARSFRRNSNVIAALGQRVAPWLGCKHEASGTEEELALLAPMLKRVLTAAIVRDIAEDLAMCGMAVLHHSYTASADGLSWTPTVKVWNLETVDYDHASAAYYAWTRELGRVRIQHGDGVWTIIGSHANVPHEHGAVIPLAMSVASNLTAMIDQNQTSNAIRSPKLIGTLPSSVPVRSEIGNDLEAALVKLLQGLGVSVVSNGTEVEKLEFNASGIGQFYDVTSKLSREDIYRALIWEPGTANAAGGNYVKEMGMRDVLYSCVKADTILAADALTEGLIRPFLYFNRGITETEASISYPLPDPDEDARMKSYAERHEKLVAIIESRRKAGFEVTQRDVDLIAADLRVYAPRLADIGTEKELFAYHQRGRLFTVNEIRKSRGFAPLPGPDGARLVDDSAQSQDAATT